MGKEPNIKREIMRRVKLLYVLFFVVGIAIFARILWLQYGPQGTKLRERAEERSFFTERIDGKRGEIFSADGQLLATSVRMYYAGMDFGVDSLTARRFNNHVDALADSLSRMFGDRSKAGYKAMLTESFNRSKKGYRRLNPRLISGEELERMKTFPLLNLSPGFGGFAPEMVFARRHPFGRLAERTLGATRSVYDTLITPNKDSTKRRTQTMLTEKGLYGIEYSFDHALKGSAGWQMMQRQTSRFATPVDSPLNEAPTDGFDVVTTLDMDFQDVASSMLAQQLVHHGALRGTVVLMEVATGEIKAIANLDNSGGTCYENYNHAIGGVDEPGSTFKLASLLALLDDGMRLDDPVEVGNGRITLRGASHRDDHDPKHHTLSLRRVFETSSNVGFVQSVETRFKEKGREKEYVDYISALGFDRPMGTSMVGEAAPIFHKPTPEAIKRGSWHKNSISYMAYGYGLEVSPLHTLALYNAIAGGGRMVRPMLIRELARDGVAVQKFHTEVINPSIAPARTIEAVRESLVGVVEDGTATVLKNPYYKVAAKTGTAQQDSYGGGAGQVYMATMVGYFPADEPKYSCIVAIWTRLGAGSSVFYGSALAGPVFKAVADRVYVTHHEWQKPVSDTLPRIAQPPRVKGGPVTAVREVAGGLDIKLRDDARRRDWVATRADSVSVYASRVEAARGTVPSVVGMGLSDALYAIESRGLRVDFSGKGRVTAQFPAAGETVRPGATVTLTLK